MSVIFPRKGSGWFCPTDKSFKYVPFRGVAFFFLLGVELHSSPLPSALCRESQPWNEMTLLLHCAVREDQMTRPMRLEPRAVRRC